MAVEGESIVSLGKPSDYIVSKTFVRPPFKVFRVWTKNRSTSLDDAVSDKSEVEEDFGYSLNFSY